MDPLQATVSMFLEGVRGALVFQVVNFRLGADILGVVDALGASISVCKFDFAFLFYLFSLYSFFFSFFRNWSHLHH